MQRQEGPGIDGQRQVFLAAAAVDQRVAQKPLVEQAREVNAEKRHVARLKAGEVVDLLVFDRRELGDFEQRGGLSEI